MIKINSCGSASPCHSANLFIALVIPFSSVHTETLLQDRSVIAGTVKDGATGELIAGATVAIKGTNLGTTEPETLQQQSMLIPSTCRIALS